MLLSAYSKVVLRDTSNEALCATTETALAVERFRLAQNRLPESLTELAPEFLDQVPQDPFNGSEIRYKLLNPGYAVYSVGEDGIDDAGREPPPRKKSTDKSTYDITFIVDH
jgi:Tfp pilus assembly protein PilE